MQLLDEIITIAASEEGSLATLLRKCLVLAHKLKNDRLKSWAESELSGYSDADNVPPYRKISAPAKGLFLGPFNSQIDNQPIPSMMLKEHHRHWAETASLCQPIASYEGVLKNDNLAMLWPGELDGSVPGQLFEGRYVLNRAWQEISPSFIIGLTDGMRTKVLSFALELKDELGEVSEDIQALPPGKVDQTFITHIYGGTAIVGSKEFTTDWEH